MSKITKDSIREVYANMIFSSSWRDYANVAWELMEKHSAECVAEALENSVRIPDVGEWESESGSDFVGLAIYAMPTWNKKEQQVKIVTTNDDVNMKLLAYIPRPVTVWVPKVDEPMFFRTGEQTANIGRYYGEQNFHFPNCFTLINTDGHVILPAKLDCKPFDSMKSSPNRIESGPFLAGCTFHPAR